MEGAGNRQRGGGGTAGSHLHHHDGDDGVEMLALRQYIRQSLIDLLANHISTARQQSIVGHMKVALVIDASVSGPLGIVAEVDVLKKHGISVIYHLTNMSITTDATHIMYMLRPHPLTLLRHIDEHVKQDVAANIKRQYSMCFVSEYTVSAQRVVTDLQLDKHMQLIDTFDLTLIPIEHDFASMENNSMYADVFVKHDMTPLRAVAASIMQLQAVYGSIRHIHGKGDVAFDVWKLVEQMEQQMLTDRTNNKHRHSITDIDSRGKISELIIIDRSIDYVTPMLTPITYEGLIDEIYTLKNGYIEVDQDVLGKRNSKADDNTTPQPPPSVTVDTIGANGGVNNKQLVKLVLNSGDAVFDDIRSVPFRLLGPLLHNKAEQIAGTYQQRHSALSVSEMHTFMQNFKTAHNQHTLLQIHINLAERVAQWARTNRFDQRIELEHAILQGVNDMNTTDRYLDSMVTRQSSLISVLRLMILMAVTDQLRSRRVDELKKLLMLAYGYGCMHTLMLLQQNHLLGNAVKRNFALIKRSLQVWTDSGDQTLPNDIAHLHNGYSPVSVRLVEKAAHSSWQAIGNILTMFDGANFDIHRSDKAQPSATASQSQNSDKLLESQNFINGGSVTTTPTPTHTISSRGSDAQSTKSQSINRVPTARKRTVLVYFIGGVTTSELAALRSLNKQAMSKHNRTYLVAATKLINANHIIDAHG